LPKGCQRQPVAPRARQEPRPPESPRPPTHRQVQRGALWGGGKFSGSAGVFLPSGVRGVCVCAQAQCNPFLPPSPPTRRPAPPAPAAGRVAGGARQPLPPNDSGWVALVSPRRGGVPGVAETNFLTDTAPSSCGERFVSRVRFRVGREEANGPRRRAPNPSTRP